VKLTQYVANLLHEYFALLKSSGSQIRIFEQQNHTNFPKSKHWKLKLLISNNLLAKPTENISKFKFV